MQEAEWFVFSSPVSVAVLLCAGAVLYTGNLASVRQLCPGEPQATAHPASPDTPKQGGRPQPWDLGENITHRGTSAGKRLQG